MSHDRLTLALEDGALVLPEAGRIAVFAPKANADLSALPQARLHIIQDFYPDHRHWAQAGYDTGTAPKGDYAAALVFLPRSKALAHALVEQAARITGGGLVIVDGQKTDGIDSLNKALKGRTTGAGVISKAHGKILWFSGGDFTGWAAADLQPAPGFVTRPGVFSAGAPDKGSIALIAALPVHLTGRVADLGAGWGYLARDLLRREAIEVLDLIEADNTALDCARRNVTDARARFFWADATDFTPRASYDTVISNPPFHAGRAGDPALGQAFIHAAAAMLKPSGQFWMVANRHLPYEAALTEHFRETREAGGTAGFKILHASKPRRLRR